MRAPARWRWPPLPCPWWQPLRFPRSRVWSSWSAPRSARPRSARTGLPTPMPSWLGSTSCAPGWGSPPHPVRPDRRRRLGVVRVDGHRRPHPDGQHDLHFAGAVRHLRGEADRARLLRPRGPEPSAAPVTGVPTPPTAQRPTAPVSRAAEAVAAVGPDGGDAPAAGDGAHRARRGAGAARTTPVMPGAPTPSSPAAPWRFRPTRDPRRVGPP